MDASAVCVPYTTIDILLNILDEYQQDPYYHQVSTAFLIILKLNVKLWTQFCSVVCTKSQFKSIQKKEFSNVSCLKSSLRSDAAVALSVTCLRNLYPANHCILTNLLMIAILVKFLIRQYLFP